MSRHDDARPGGHPGAGAVGASVGDRPAHHILSHRPGTIGGSLAAPLLARLDRVIPAGTGRWYARCPAHDDKSPSLSIRETDGKVLLHCFAGCFADDILAAVGVEWRDLYPDKWECAAKRPIRAVHDYAQRIFSCPGFELEIDRQMVALAAEAGAGVRDWPAEDQARLKVAVLRLEAAKEVARG